MTIEQKYKLIDLIEKIIKTQIKINKYNIKLTDQIIELSKIKKNLYKTKTEEEKNE